MSDGRFIVLEGGEGTGKSTQARLLCARLRDAGVPVLSVREPGGTHVGDALRHLVLDPATGSLAPRAELLIYEASRAQHVAQVIAPALEAGTWVVCDRYGDSSVAYQGYGRGLDLDEVRDLNRIATGGLAPDLTIVIDLDPRVGVERATGTGADRIEAEELAFHERVRAGYLEIAELPGRVAVDGSGGVDEIAEAIWREVAALGPATPSGGAR